MFTEMTRTFGACALAALATQALAQDAAPQQVDSRLHFSASVDVTNAYFFRGILQEDQGFIAQPAAALTADLVRNDDFTLSATLGTWNSAHSEGTGSATSDTNVKHWYESDLYISLGASFGKWTLDATYTWYLSPNDAFESIEELAFSASFDDSEYLGAFALSPSVTIAFETGSNYADGADSDRGIYLGLSVAPGFETTVGADRTLAFSFPVEVGLSIDDYYQDGAGDDDTFGYASVGARVETALAAPAGFGEWTVYAAVNALFLGDNLESVNNDDAVDFVASIGISLAF